MYTAVTEQMNVQYLMARYGLNSRTSLYTRLKHLGIELAKDDKDRGFATSEQLKLLDQLHEHIKAGNSMASFVKASDVDVMPMYTVQGEHTTKTGGLDSQRSKSHRTVQQTVQVSDSAMLLESLVGAIINNIHPSKNPLEKYRDLKECEQENWLLTTKDIEDLVGRKPRKIKGQDYCLIGGWKFIARGKAGNQSLWSVEQLKL